MTRFHLNALSLLYIGVRIWTWRVLLCFFQEKLWLPWRVWELCRRRRMSTDRRMCRQQDAVSRKCQLYDYRTMEGWVSLFHFSPDQRIILEFINFISCGVFDTDYGRSLLTVFCILRCSGAFARLVTLVMVRTAMATYTRWDKSNRRNYLPPWCWFL